MTERRRVVFYLDGTFEHARYFAGCYYAIEGQARAWALGALGARYAVEEGEPIPTPPRDGSAPSETNEQRRERLASVEASKVIPERARDNEQRRERLAKAATPLPRSESNAARRARMAEIEAKKLTMDASQRAAELEDRRRVAAATIVAEEGEEGEVANG